MTHKNEEIVLDTNNITQIIRSYSNIENAVNALYQKLPFSKQTCYNIVNDLVEENDENKDKYNDINEHTEIIISSFDDNELHEMQQIFTADNYPSITTNNKINTAATKQVIRINWNHIIQCVNHEMWPKLGSIIEAIINNKDKTKHKIIGLYDLTDQCIDDVVEILKSKRNLAIAERIYFSKLVTRARTFTPFNNQTTKDIIRLRNNTEFLRDFDRKHKGFNASLLNDIFNIHRAFMFANFDFYEYSLDDFKKHITNNGNIYLG
eukprot:50972_1